MKKCFLILLIGLLFPSTCTLADNLLDNAISRAYINKLTVYPERSGFLPENTIDRDEAAKFFVNFAKLIGKTTYTVDEEQCEFSDLEDAREDLQEYILESCRLGIFKGAHGKFHPKGNLSNAESVAVVIRIIEGYRSEKGLSHRANNYYKRANELNLLNTVNMGHKDSDISRGHMITILYGAKDMEAKDETLTEISTEPTTGACEPKILNNPVDNMIPSQYTIQYSWKTPNGKMVYLLHGNGSKLYIMANDSMHDVQSEQKAGWLRLDDIVYTAEQVAEKGLSNVGGIGYREKITFTTSGGNLTIEQTSPGASINIARNGETLTQTEPMDIGKVDKSCLPQGRKVQMEGKLNDTEILLIVDSKSKRDRNYSTRAVINGKTYPVKYSYSPLVGTTYRTPIGTLSLDHAETRKRNEEELEVTFILRHLG